MNRVWRRTFVPNREKGRETGEDYIMRSFKEDEMGRECSMHVR
jgi:hypothetical protein